MPPLARPGGSRAALERGPTDRAVWRAVRAIPRGKVSTYGDVAKSAGMPRGARRVAAALRSAPPGLPWHRVLGAGGRILLRATSAWEQRFRLEAEGVRFSGKRVLMKEHQHGRSKSK